MQIVLDSGIQTNRVATGFQATIRATEQGIVFFFISPPTQCYNYKRRFQNGEKAQETTRLMQRGLSHLSTANTIE